MGGGENMKATPGLTNVFFYFSFELLQAIP